MRKTAALLLALFLALSMSLTAFANVGPPGPQQPSPQDGNLSGDGGNDDGNDGEPFDEETAPAETSPTEATEAAAQDITEAPLQETQPASDATEAESISQQDGTSIFGAQESNPPVEKAAEDAREGNQNNTVIVIVIVCGSILLILLIVIAVLLLRKKQPKSGGAASVSDTGPGLPVRIEVLSGLCYNANFDFRIRRNLTIGTDKGCDLVFEDKAMHPMHAVIIADNNTVMLEESSAAGVTYIGGMKIFSSNRLRSGDVITIGSTSFRITFEEN